MRTHIKHQIIEKSGQPLFALVPWDEYQLFLNKNQTWYGDDIPSDVVDLIVDKNISIIKAWRVFLKLTQTEVASRIGIEQSALARIEKQKTIPKKMTIKKIAEAMGLIVEQLDIESV